MILRDKSGNLFHHRNLFCGLTSAVGRSSRMQCAHTVNLHRYTRVSIVLRYCRACGSHFGFRISRHCRQHAFDQHLYVLYHMFSFVFLEFWSRFRQGALRFLICYFLDVKFPFHSVSKGASTIVQSSCPDCHQCQVTSDC